MVLLAQTSCACVVKLLWFVFRGNTSISTHQYGQNAIRREQLSEGHAQDRVVSLIQEDFDEATQIVRPSSLADRKIDLRSALPLSELVRLT